MTNVSQSLRERFIAKKLTHAPDPVVYDPTKGVYEDGQQVEPASRRDRAWLSGKTRIVLDSKTGELKILK